MRRRVRGAPIVERQRAGAGRSEAADGDEELAVVDRDSPHARVEEHVRQREAEREHAERHDRVALPSANVG